MLPLKNAKITSEYGIIRNNKLHTGLDFISSSGDKEVRAICDGTVRIVAYDEYGYGNYISIEQVDGYRALYCHLESVSVKQGQEVKAGDVLGIEGTTGNSTGIHLHLELRQAPFAKMNHINVADYLEIQNLKGIVRPKEDRFKDEKEALAFLIEKGFITEGDYWFKTLEVVNKQKYLILKFANYVYKHNS